MLRSLLRVPKVLKFQARLAFPPLYKSFPTYTFARFSTSQTTNEHPQLLEQVETKIFEILKSAAKCKTDKLSRKATFDELGFDSLDTVELVVAMEENLALDLQDEDAEKIQTVDDAVKIFHKYAVQKLEKVNAQEKEEAK